MNKLSNDEKELKELEETNLNIKEVIITYNKQNEHVYRILFYEKKGAKVLTSCLPRFFDIPAAHHYIQIKDDLDIISMKKIKSLTIGSDKKQKIMLPHCLIDLSICKAHSIVNLKRMESLKSISISGIKRSKLKPLYDLSYLPKLSQLNLSDAVVCLTLPRTINSLILFNSELYPSKNIDVINLVSVNSKLIIEDFKLISYYLNNSTIGTNKSGEDKLIIKDSTHSAEYQISDYFKTKMSLLDFDIMYQDSFKFGSFLFDKYPELSGSDFEFIKLYTSLVVSENGRTFMDFLMLKQHSQSSSSS